jgi:MFS family permease
LLQGAGAAMLIPQVRSLIQLMFSGTARARAVSLYSMTLGLGVAAGLLLGGLLITVGPGGLSWRAVFLINVPIGCLALAGGRLWLPADRAGARRRLDRRGLLLFTAAITLLVVPLAFGPSSGWPAWTWVMLAVGLAAVLAFPRAERVAGRHGIQPLLDLAALGVPGMVPGLVVVFVSMGGYGALVYTMSAYLQEGLRYGVLRSGVIFAAYAIGFGLVNLTWSKLPGRYHRWVPPVALTVLCLAEAALAIATRNGFVLAAVVPLLAAAGAGHGAGFGAVVARLTAHMPTRYAQTASGLINTTTQLAILSGIAGLGSAFLAARQPAGPAGGYAHSMSGLLIVLAACSAIAVLCSFRISQPLRGNQDTGAGSSVIG